MAAIEATDATFEKEVLDASMSKPVVVDLWAPWCQPCLTLGPLIEKAVRQTDGAALLVKVNVDESPLVSQSFQVQSIPAVFALYRRRVVDRFIGALPEAEVAGFVEKVLAISKPSGVELLIDEATESSLRQAMELEPANAEATRKLAALLAERGEGEEALELLGRIPETPETRRIAALARTGPEAALSPDDLAARITSLIERLPGDEEARQQVVDLIETMDEGDDRRSAFRRALAARLF